MLKGEKKIMKQKFVISRDSDKKELIIKEYAEIEKDRLSLVCEETYDDKVIKTAMEKSKEALYSALRTDKLYPPIFVTMNIGEAIIEVYGSKNKPSTEFVFNNIDFITKDGEKPEIEDNIEDNEDDLHPALYSYVLLQMPKSMPFDIQHQSHHRVIDFMLNGLNIGRVS